MNHSETVALLNRLLNQLDHVTFDESNQHENVCRVLFILNTLLGGKIKRAINLSKNVKVQLITRESDNLMIEVVNNFVNSETFLVCETHNYCTCQETLTEKLQGKYLGLCVHLVLAKLIKKLKFNAEQFTLGDDEFDILLLNDRDNKM